MAPSQSLKSAEELEEEDRVAQSAVRNMDTCDVGLLLLIVNQEIARIDSSRTTTGLGGSQSAYESDDWLCKYMKRTLLYVRGCSYVFSMIGSTTKAKLSAEIRGGAAQDSRKGHFAI